MTKNAGNILCTEVVPRLQAAIPYAVSFIGCEDAQEVIQDGVAMAAKIIHNSEQAGKKVTRSASNRVRKEAKAVSHSSVTGTDLIRLLCAELHNLKDKLRQGLL
jgi:NADH:ubiquinone oxidoreductase subunit B-like Fe-S oxidoreductase